MRCGHFHLLRGYYCGDGGRCDDGGDGDVRGDRLDYLLPEFFELMMEEDTTKLSDYEGEQKWEWEWGWTDLSPRRSVGIIILAVIFLLFFRNVFI